MLNSNWFLAVNIIYAIIIIFVIMRVLYDTRSSTKALAYILFIVFVPIIGVLFYFTFGINYRKRKLYSKKIVEDEPLRKRILDKMNAYSESISNSGLITDKHQTLVEFIRRAGRSPLTANNQVKLLINGEEKFPELLKALSNAKLHIHIEYYIYENDNTGNQVAEILIQKAQEGVEVRFMYDDFGSHGLGNDFIKKLQNAGVQTAPFYKIKWYAFANRLNYRNHRKIIIIDGDVSFVGGINMSDRYRNDFESNNQLFWRDTHVMITGQATAYLQYLFLCDWNFCSHTNLDYSEIYFPDNTQNDNIENDMVQIAASGPDSVQPVIFYSLLKAIGSAKKSIYITSPYFIPGESLMDALIIAIQSGLDVKIIIPGESDSVMVNAAASAYYTELLYYGAQIYKYNKGFVHSKTMVVDDDLAIIGSANMDYRSFDLNFEVNAMVYSKDIAKQLQNSFFVDLKESSEIDAAKWLSRPKYIHVWEKFVRLLSPFL
ncbi:cardiolipin synthase [Bizionia argentinensis JUB59]|uniref:Cardiolipin synthase n=1 Tax=Bizionia argentinensis JUB59 TaxID=1046627 RepID=G2ECV8_9FLAO|nr:cardiolipin synthase [Bizionia argentinensis]EGV43733.1 cardiolipin synthase [Bizionia argentinensis JUB59]